MLNELIQAIASCLAGLVVGAAIIVMLVIAIILVFAP